MSALDDYIASLDPANAAQRQLTPLPPEQTDSALNTLLQKGAGALGWAGRAAGKALGGAAIRSGLGLLVGDPKAHARELLSVIPFSDTLGITDPSQEYRGEDLLKQTGLLEGEGEKGTFELRDLAGPALEAALDPATYLGFGAKHAATALGKAAGEAGAVLPKGIAAGIQGFKAGTPEIAAAAAKMGVPEAELAGKPLRGLASVGLPFTEGATVGTGPTAQKIGGAVDAASQWLGQTKPALIGKSLFSRDVQPLMGGQVAPDAASQAMNVASRDIYNAKLPDIKMGYAKTQQALDAAGHADKGPEMIGLQEGRAGALASAPEVQQAADAMTARNAEILKETHEMGIPLAQRDNYAHRELNHYPDIESSNPRHGGDGTVFSGGSMASRENIFNRHDTLTINDIARDPVLDKVAKGGAVEGNLLEAQKYLLDKYEPNYNHQEWLNLEAQKGNLQAAAGSAPELEQLKQLVAQNPGHPGLEQKLNEMVSANMQLEKLKDMQNARSVAGGLADWKSGLDPKYSEGAGRDFFNTNAVYNQLQREIEHAKKMSTASAAYDALAQNAVRSDVPLPGHSNLHDALASNGLGMSYGEGVPDSGAVQGALRRMLESLQKVQGGPIDAGEMPLKSYQVPNELLGNIFRYQKLASSPSALQPILKAWDYVTNLTKAYQTLPWPANWTRDALTDLWQSAATGGGLNLAEAFNIRRGGDAAAQALRNEMYAHGISGGKSGLTDFGGATIREPLVPGKAADQGLFGGVREAFMSGGKNPLDAGEFAPLKGAREAKDDIYNLIKEADYIGRRKSGQSAEYAAAQVKAAHGDFSAATPFERDVMKRVVPFYSWMRHNLPWTLEEMVTNPGGLTSQAVKGTVASRQDQGFVPEYLGEGVSAKLGPEENGVQRFFTRTGLPFEDFLPLDPSRGAAAGMDLLGQTNPLIKAPLELATGKQFFTGRDLADVSSHGLTGMTPVDQAITNSPLGRFFTTGRTLTDERKGVGAKALNLLTGARVSDVDMEKARNIEARQLIEEALKGKEGVGHFERLSVKPENAGQLSPEEILMYRIYQTLEKQSQQKAKQGKIAMQP